MLIFLDSPFGKLPVLEIDGKKIHQSLAICRFLAKRTGLEPKSEWDSVQADSLVDTLTDLRLLFSAAIHEKDPAKKKEQIENILKNESPSYFSKFDKIIKENNGTIVKDQVGYFFCFWS